MPTVRSLRDFAFDSLEVFVYREGFTPNVELAKGIAYLANVICHYEEESVRLKPEVVITTDLISVAKTLPAHILTPIATGPISLDTFKKALKACAPLARDNWIIYFDIGSESINYGLLASGMSLPNPSPYSHLKIGFSELPPPIIYIKAISPQLLLVKGKGEEFVISFSLEEVEYNDTNYFAIVAEAISRDVAEEWRSDARDLFTGLLEQASEASHGCLIAVVKGSREAFGVFKDNVTNGIFIPEPIDVVKYMIEAQQTHDSNAQMSLMSLCTIVKRMIGHDGITLFSSEGQLLAYNLFVPSNDDETRHIIGGARSRAYQKLCLIPELSCAMIRSQDGAMKIFQS
jgi:hypothetical protein